VFNFTPAGRSELNVLTRFPHPVYSASLIREPGVNRVRNLNFPMNNSFRFNYFAFTYRYFFGEERSGEAERGDNMKT